MINSMKLKLEYLLELTGLPPCCTNVFLRRMSRGFDACKKKRKVATKKKKKDDGTAECTCIFAFAEEIFP
jgi:hypothetical protein